MSDSGPAGTAIVLVVDLANVVGSVPDGWWRDRAGAAERLLGGLCRLYGRTFTGPRGDPIRLARILAVVEGRAKQANNPQCPGEGFVVVRASGSGDDALTEVATDAVAAGDLVLVVSADRGLRERLPREALTTGPGWLNALLGRG